MTYLLKYLNGLAISGKQNHKWRKKDEIPLKSNRKKVVTKFTYLLIVHHSSVFNNDDDNTDTNIHTHIYLHALIGFGFGLGFCSLITGLHNIYINLYIVTSLCEFNQE